MWEAEKVKQNECIIQITRVQTYGIANFLEYTPNAAVDVNFFSLQEPIQSGETL